MLVTPQFSRDTPLCLEAVGCAAPFVSELSHTMQGTAAGTAQGAEEVLKDCDLPRISRHTGTGGNRGGGGGGAAVKSVCTATAEDESGQESLMQSCF